MRNGAGAREGRHRRARSKMEVYYRCAMRSGEFGAIYRVTADNGKSVTVRLNDREPYIKGGGQGLGCP